MDNTGFLQSLLRAQQNSPKEKPYWLGSVVHESTVPQRKTDTEECNLIRVHILVCIHMKNLTLAKIVNFIICA